MLGNNSQDSPLVSPCLPPANHLLSRRCLLPALSLDETRARRGPANHSRGFVDKNQPCGLRRSCSFVFAGGNSRNRICCSRPPPAIDPSCRAVPASRHREDSPLSGYYIGLVSRSLCLSPSLFAPIRAVERQLGQYCQHSVPLEPLKSRCLPCGFTRRGINLGTKVRKHASIDFDFDFSRSCSAHWHRYDRGALVEHVGDRVVHGTTAASSWTCAGGRKLNSGSSRLHQNPKPTSPLGLGGFRLDIPIGVSGCRLLLPQPWSFMPDIRGHHQPCSSRDNKFLYRTLKLRYSRNQSWNPTSTSSHAASPQLPAPKHALQTTTPSTLRGRPRHG